MKKLFFFLAISVFLTLWAFGLILPDAGYVLVLLGQKSVESSLWFVCFAAVAIVFIGWIIKKCILASWTLAQSISDFLIFGSAERASKRAASGLVDFFAGDWLQARKKLLRTATKVESPLVNYLAAARASYELGDREEAFKLLSDAQKKYQHFSVSIGLVQAKMELNDGHLEQAKHILLGLQLKAPKHPLVLLALCKIYQQRGEWSALTELLPLVKKNKIHSATAVIALESSLLAAQLTQAGEITMSELPADRLHSLRKAWAKVPSAQQKIPHVVAAYARALIQNNEHHEAEALLRKVLSKAWDDSLVDIYGVLQTNDITEAMRTAENWLKYYPQNPRLLRALGRLSLRNHLWGIARDYFQRSLAVQPDVETYGELARLLNSLDDSSQVIEVYQSALRLQLSALPDLPLPTKKF